jgi:CRP/FNR family cyclic AMP-dependent transcriptional regulator
LACCSRNLRFAAGQYLFREGALANEFLLLREGTAAPETAAPEKASIDFNTLAGGDIAGACWLAPPFRWIFDARAVTPTWAIDIDAACLSALCNAYPQLGYEIMKHFFLILAQQFDASRLQFFDVHARANLSPAARFH